MVILNYVIFTLKTGIKPSILIVIWTGSARLQSLHMYLNRQGKHPIFHRTACASSKNNEIFGFIYGDYSVRENRC